MSDRGMEKVGVGRERDPEVTDGRKFEFNARSFNQSQVQRSWGRERGYEPFFVSRFCKRTYSLCPILLNVYVHTCNDSSNSHRTPVFLLPTLQISIQFLGFLIYVFFAIFLSFLFCLDAFLSSELLQRLAIICYLFFSSSRLANLFSLLRRCLCICFQFLCPLLYIVCPLLALSRLTSRHYLRLRLRLRPVALDFCLPVTIFRFSIHFLSFVR
ncbi:hypothetical protein K435DRAFT_341534 [Dendrothele bispora CBS 962.96]|uniref:Transmembrane protein n=1 Tax=Dendrothele bispora (strain CBS 962.96) TaxID=1314807 RepID=A0A4S8LG70_DENBC|nr:hypothetical protein K435DRAFT_341534 [Dendrothele bispora CBS 962.96]